MRADLRPTAKALTLCEAGHLRFDLSISRAQSVANFFEEIKLFLPAVKGYEVEIQGEDIHIFNKQLGIPAYSIDPAKVSRILMAGGRLEFGLNSREFSTLIIHSEQSGSLGTGTLPRAALESTRTTRRSTGVKKTKALPSTSGESRGVGGSSGESRGVGGVTRTSRPSSSGGESHGFSSRSAG